MLFYYKLSTNSRIFSCPLAKFVLNRCPVTKFAYIWRSLDEIRVSSTILRRNSHFFCDPLKKFTFLIRFFYAIRDFHRSLGEIRVLHDRLTKFVFCVSDKRTKFTFFPHSIKKIAFYHDPLTKITYRDPEGIRMYIVILRRNWCFYCIPVKTFAFSSDSVKKFCFYCDQG